MNIRFSKDQVRFRISEEEYRKLLSRGELQETTQLEGIFRAGFCIRVHDANSTDAPLLKISNGGHFCLEVRRQDLAELNLGASRKNLALTSDQAGLALALEVDAFSILNDRSSPT